MEKVMLCLLFFIVAVKVKQYTCSILVVCQDGDVRLMGGSHYREGKVEVCRNQQWGRVCNDEWDENDSAVVCRQLGLLEEGTYQEVCTMK